MVEELAEKYEWEPASIRSALARMSKPDGDIVNVKRGVYRARNQDDVLNDFLATVDAESPTADTEGLSDSVTASEEGGPANDTPSHDPDHDTTGWNRDRGDHPVDVAG